MKDSRREELLKDRRDYRQTLIQKREDLERKIERTEKDIAKLKTPR